MLTGQNIIGSALSQKGSTTFQVFNPSNGEVLTTNFFEASNEEINEAIELAEEAFLTYKDKSGSEKALLLESMAHEILALGEALIKRCMEETGLPEVRLTGERTRTVNQLNLFAALLREGSWVEARIDLADPERKPLPKPDLRSMLKPLGPVGVFGASNFPFAFSVAGGDTASALAAGCPVVFKAHPAHPGTCELVGTAIQRAIEKTKMPEGTFSMIQGKSTAVGTALVRHPLIKAIGFTGSYNGGKALFDEANKREVPIPVYAEMGSSNPVFILDGALAESKESIAKDLAASVTLGTGQFCTNPGLVFLSDSDQSKSFKELMAATVTAVSSGVMLSENIQQNYVRGVERLKQSSNVSVLASGKTDGEGCRGSAVLFETTGNTFLHDHSLEEEVFGPSTIAVSAKDKNELLTIAKNLKGHLTATIIGNTRDLENHADLIGILEQKVGRLIINGYPTGVEVAHAMVHGGPFPATSDSRSTSVGTLAIKRFCRPVCYQNFPSFLLPEELRDENKLKIMRLVNGEWAR